RRLLLSPGQGRLAEQAPLIQPHGAAVDLTAKVRFFSYFSTDNRFLITGHNSDVNCDKCHVRTPQLTPI
ncbi:MAG: hypothetical protein ACR2RE_25475, partial [Geminicoccaceae bacterium]